MHDFYIHAVVTMRPLDAPFVFRLIKDSEEVDDLRTSAALAAACPGLEDPSGA